MRSIRRRQPAQAAPQRRRIRPATSSKVRRQAGVGAGRPRNAARLRAPRDRRPRRRRRRPPPSPRQRSMRARQGYAVRAPGVRVLSGPSVFTLAPRNGSLAHRFGPSPRSMTLRLRTHGMHARDVGVQALEPGNEALQHQELKRPVHGRRSDRPRISARDRFDQLVGARRPTARPKQFQDTSPQRCHLYAAPLANRCGEHDPFAWRVPPAAIRIGARPGSGGRSRHRLSQLAAGIRNTITLRPGSQETVIRDVPTLTKGPGHG